MSSIYFDYTVMWFRAIFSALLGWYMDIYEILGMTSLWIGVVVLVIVFTVVLVPLRGGSGISGGAIGDFTVTSVNASKARERQAKAEAYREETRRYRAQQAEYYRSRSRYRK